MIKICKIALLVFLIVGASHTSTAQRIDYRSMYEEYYKLKEAELREFRLKKSEQDKKIQRLEAELARINNPYWVSKAKQEERAKKNEQNRRKEKEKLLAQKNEQIEELDRIIGEKIIEVESAAGNNTELRAKVEKLKKENESYLTLLNGRCACCMESSPDTVAIAKKMLEDAWTEYRNFEKEEKYLSLPEEEVKTKEKLVVDNLFRVVNRYKIHLSCEQNIEYIEFLKKNRVDVRLRLFPSDMKMAYNIFYPVEVFSAIRRGFDLSDYDCRKDMSTRIFPKLKEYLEGIDETPPQIKGELTSAVSDFKRKEYSKCLGKIVKFYDSYGKTLDPTIRGQIEYCYGTILLWNLGNVYALKDLGVLNSQLASDLVNPQSTGQRILQNVLAIKGCDDKIKKQAYKALETYY